MIDEAHISAAAPHRLPMYQVAMEVASMTGVNASELLGHSRKSPVARARQCLMFILHREMGIPSVAVGHFLKRDHTTVLYGCRAHAERLAKLEQDRQEKSTSPRQITVAPSA